MILAELEKNNREIKLNRRKQNMLVKSLIKEISSIDYNTFYGKDAINKCRRINNLNSELAYVTTQLTIQLERTKLKQD